MYIDTLIYLMHKSTMPNFQNDAKNFRLEINVASIGTIMIRDVVLIKQHSKWFSTFVEILDFHRYHHLLYHTFTKITWDEESQNI